MSKVSSDVEYLIAIGNLVGTPLGEEYEYYVNCGSY
jgi:hypothetical protein